VGSADDAVEILDLLGRYSFAADEGTPEDYAGVFTDDGAFVGRVGQPDEIRIEGREALLRFAGAAAKRKASGAAAGTRHHHASPTIVELTATTAHVRSYLLVTLAGTDVGLTSIYDDRLVKTPDGWRIAERRALPDVKGRLRG
jgi:hypothetical protein